MSNVELDATFFERIAAAMPGVGPSACQHNHHHTRAALSAVGADVNAGIAALKRHGGYCDCEVMMNCMDLTLIIPAAPDDPPQFAHGKTRSEQGGAP